MNFLDCGGDLSRKSRDGPSNYGVIGAPLRTYNSDEIDISVLVRIQGAVPGITGITGVGRNEVVGLGGVVSVFLMIGCGIISEPLVGEAIGIPDPAIFIPFGAIIGLRIQGAVLELLKRMSSLAVFSFPPHTLQGKSIERHFKEGVVFPNRC